LFKVSVVLVRVIKVLIHDVQVNIAKLVVATVTGLEPFAIVFVRLRIIHFCVSIFLRVIASVIQKRRV
jgi:hypothetical protein